MPRSPDPWWTDWDRQTLADVAGIFGVAAITLIAAWPLLSGGTVVGEDAVTFFYPMYHFLGQQLRVGHLPGWNPSQFAGVPFAADPESGWMYVPAMLFFSVLPFTAAARALVVFHLALAGLATYGLARLLGIGVIGALVASTAYVYSATIYQRAACCVVHTQVASWLPLMLSGAELALRADTWTRRAIGWMIGGFALSQILAGWLGQGAYYALLALGGFVAYRTLLSPPPDSVSHRSNGRQLILRLQALALHGVSLLFIGFGLAAAGLLPRLAYNARTDLAGGTYRGTLGWAADLGGWLPRDAANALLGQTVFYAGGAVLALALLAPILAGRRFAVPAFVLIGGGALLLTAKHENALQALLYRVLPRFAEINRHWPHRATLIFYLAPAILAGATVDILTNWRGRPASLALAASAPVAAALLLVTSGVSLARPTAVAIILVAVILGLIAILPRGDLRRVAAILLLLVVLFDLRGADARIMRSQRDVHKVNLNTYFVSSGAVRFLAASEASQPSRFFGYDPGIHPANDPTPPLYRFHYMDPRAISLLVNNRAMLFGLSDIQGYNPIQPRRFVDFMTALNGHAQEYHEANVYPSGLTSPLLNLLNVRYIVVPARIPANRPDLMSLIDRWPTVYQDAAVRILENQDALPRAWLVHASQQATAPDVLRLLASGSIDPRQVALVETPAPNLSPTSDVGDEHVTVTLSTPDRLQLSVRADGNTLVMVSETYDSDWRAYVDGRPVGIVRADYLFRAVPVPAGVHRVEFRYQPPSLTLGLLISSTVFTLWVSLLGFAGFRRIRARRQGSDSSLGLEPVCGNTTISDVHGPARTGMVKLA